MATIKVRWIRGLTRQIAAAAFVLAGMFLGAGANAAQEAPASPGQTREILRRGIELHKSRDYEKAAGFFGLAQAGAPGLSAADQQDLATFSAQNASALKARQDGAVQLQQAEEAVKQGRILDASQLVQTLNGNQYLSDKEKQQVSDLSKRMKAQTTGASTQSGKTDAKSLLSAGRAALQAGDYAQAEALAAQADKAASALAPWFRPWDDSPARLKRDIQAAKTKKDQPAAPPKSDPDAKGSSWLPSMNWFGKAEKPPTPPDPAPKNPDPAATSKFLGLIPLGGGQPSKEQASERRVDEMMARQMVKDGFFFLEQANEPDKARMLATKAKELNVTWGPNEKTPDLLLHEIQRRAGGAKPVETPTAKPDDTPTTKPAASTDPRVLLKLGRTLLAQKKYEEADKTCSQALAANGRWGLWEDTPEKLRRDIMRIRQASERDESVKLMVDARKLFTAGNLEDAEKKAYRAQQLHGPYGVFDFGDRPNKLLEEIKVAKLARGPVNSTEKPKDTTVAKEPQFPTIPAGVAQANKNRAIVMVREARDLERQNLLAEARLKAIEARALKANFTPDEDSPDNVLLGLAGKCDRVIQNHLQQGHDALANVNDPQRAGKVQEQIAAARKLAQTFDLDTTRIDQAMQQFAQVLAGTRPLQTIGGVGPIGQDPLVGDRAKVEESTGDPHKDQLRKAAREKLEHARRELSAGKYEQARKMCEELFNPAYGIQEDVLRLVRSINAEMYNQQALEAKRNFDAALDCMVKHDYKTARGILERIDPLMLPDQYRTRLPDIMSIREMQPQVVQAGGFEKYPVKGHPIEVKTPTTEPKGKPDEENPLDDYGVKMKLQYQQLRQRGAESMRTAHEIFKNAKTDEQRNQAIRTLDNFIEQVNLAQLEKAKAEDLRRTPENTIRQYRAQLADSKLRGYEEAMRNPMKYSESGRQRKIMEQQQQIVDMMKEAHELMNQRKNKEAEAIARRVLDIDPENRAAFAMVTIADVREKQKKHDDDVHLNEKLFMEQQTGYTGPSLTLEHPLEFNREMINRRDKYNSGAIPHDLKDPKERAIEYRLRQPISFNFKDVPLRDAIEAIKVQSGIQVVPDMRALQSAHINLDAPLTIAVEDIDMKFALNIMLKPLSCAYIIEDQVLKITTEDRTTGRLKRVTYPIADLIVAVEDHPLPDNLDIVKVLANSMNQQQYIPGVMMPSPYPMANGTAVSSHDGRGLGSAFGAQNPQNGQHAGTPPKDRSKDAMAAQLKELIMNTVAKEKWDDMGGTGTIQYFPMGMALVINQTLEVQEEVALLLGTLRKLQDLQVSVELRAVLVSEMFFERIGIDFDMNIQTPISRTEPALLQNQFVPAPFVNRFGRGLHMISGLTSAGTLTPDLGIPIRNNSWNFTTPQFGGYQPEAGLSLGLAFLSDIQVFMFLEAVQGDRRAHIMQAPKLTVYNGQTATIGGLVVRPQVTGLIPSTLPNGQAFMTPQMSQMPFGLTMTVLPVVSPDRRFIRLNVTPQLANGLQDPAGAIVVAVPSAAQGIFDGGIGQPPLPNAPLNVQFQPSTANLLLANTTVNVPDGGTVLLGGFKFLAEERTEYGPPLLSKIPYLSRLFRNVGWSRDGATLIYLVTARVIMIEEEENIFLGVQDRIPGR